MDLDAAIEYWRELAMDEAFERKRELYFRTAESLEMERADGIARCVCHLLPYDECQALKRKGLKS